MIEITGYNVNIETVWQVAHQPEVQIKLSDEAKKKMAASRKYIMDRVAAGEVIYGVNTGFGAFSSVSISPAQIVELQKNLIRSHSMGIGQPFSKAESRAMMFLRANALANGHSGIRPLVAEKIIEFLNHDIVPYIPGQGSVGASGDLAPLSHLALAIIGEGYVWGEKGERVAATSLLNKKNVKPLELEAKEGLSMINGCQVMTAKGLLEAYRARRALFYADLTGAMTLEALKGSRRAFDPLISAVRPHPGEVKTARNLLKILGPSSDIAESHINCSKVQDAYSLRCMPQVHGSVKDAMRFGIEVLEREANSSTDNPLVFAEEQKVLSCGNFHGQPVANALDFMAIALTSLASISECRLAQMINPAMSGLPAFLAPDGGLNSGHMIVQVAAASLVSECKVLSHPASVDSIPTSADKEDHVSMGTIAARKLGQIVDATEQVLAMEFLSATQALDMVKPLKPAAAVLGAHDLIRKHVPFAAQDRIFSEDVATIHSLMTNEALLSTMLKTVGELEW